MTATRLHGHLSSDAVGLADTAWMPGTDPAERDNPSSGFIRRMRDLYPVEEEIDRALTRKMERRAGPAYQRVTIGMIDACLGAMLHDKGVREFHTRNHRWMTGGVSKIQLAFDLSWQDESGPRDERMVIRMDPSEGSNATSRQREFDVLAHVRGHLPVPEVFWVDPDGRWFPEPALVYAFAEGVAKPSRGNELKVSGIGTYFPPALRTPLAEQFISHLARLHSLAVDPARLASFTLPPLGTAESAVLQLNRAARIWDEDRFEDSPVIEVALSWLRENAPALDHCSINHGDYRSGNFLFDENAARITTWLDWERCFIGDRHRDLAWTTQLSVGNFSGRDGSFLVCGLVPFDEFVDRYSHASGLEVDRRRLDYYRILNAAQVYASVSASAGRVVRLGKTHQDIVLVHVQAVGAMVMDELRELLERAA